MADSREEEDVWAGVVVGTSVVAVVVVAGVGAALALRRRLRAKSQLPQQPPACRVVNRTPLYERGQQVCVKAQLGLEDSRPRSAVEEGCFPGGYRQEENGSIAPDCSITRAKSVDCLLEKSLTRAAQEASLRRGSSSSTYSLDTLHPATSTLKRGPFIEFTVQWASSTCCLSVYVVRLCSLPPKYHRCSCSLTVTLTRPGQPHLTRTSARLRNATLNPECSHLFSYPVVALEDLPQSVLVFGLQVRRSKHLLNREVGELRYSLSEAQLKPDSPLTATEPLRLRKKELSPFTSGPGVKRRSSSGSGGGGGGGGQVALSEPWGQLQVVAQCKMTSAWQARVKVVVVRAHSLLITKGSGDYRMKIVVKRGEDTVMVHQTKLVAGPNLVWNTPFIFDVAQNKVSEHWIEMELVHVSWMKKTSILGHAFLGLDTTPSGSKHWKDIMDSLDKEVTAWHPIVLHE